MWPFKSKEKKAEERLLDFGPDPDLEPWERVARREFILAVLKASPGKTVAQVAALADCWEILEGHSQSGNEPPRTIYIPCPYWGNDWMWREEFSTHEEARAYIQSRTGATYVEGTPHD